MAGESGAALAVVVSGVLTLRLGRWRARSRAALTDRMTRVRQRKADRADRVFHESIERRAAASRAEKMHPDCIRNWMR
jgi:hypothetical protein